MPFCSRCGIEVDKYVKSCPLCDTPIQVLDEEHDDKRKFPIRNIHAMGAPMSKKQKRNLVWGIITLLIFIPIFVILTVRFLYSKDFTWEGYTLIPLAAGWIYFSLLLFFFKKVQVIIAGFFLNTNSLLFFIDLINGGVSWYLQISLPVTILLFLIILLVTIAGKRAKRKGVNIAAFILIGICVFCLGVEFTVSLYQSDIIILKWSIIVLVALIPVIVFFLYVHYILKTKIDWEKKFYT